AKNSRTRSAPSDPTTASSMWLSYLYLNYKGGYITLKRGCLAIGH
ncbi:MAG: hypothetical protein ACI9DH_000688, partial [Halioglobus sp.]